MKYFSAKLKCKNTNIDIDLVFLSDQVSNVIETKMLTSHAWGILSILPKRKYRHGSRSPKSRRSYIIKWTFFSDYHFQSLPDPRVYPGMRRLQSACNESFPCSMFLDPCSPNQCQNGGQCIRSGSSGFTCNCPPEWSGTRCDQYSKCLGGGLQTRSGPTQPRPRDFIP